MNDDIVTRLRERHGSFRMAVGVNDAFVLETIYAEAAAEIEQLRNENKIMANLLWDFMENTDENLSANLSILHRAAKTFAFKRLEMCDQNDPCEMCKE